MVVTYLRLLRSTRLMVIREEAMVSIVGGQRVVCKRVSKWATNVRLLLRRLLLFELSLRRPSQLVFGRRRRGWRLLLLGHLFISLHLSAFRFPLFFKQ